MYNLRLYMSWNLSMSTQILDNVISTYDSLPLHMGTLECQTDWPFTCNLCCAKSKDCWRKWRKSLELQEVILFLVCRSCFESTPTYIELHTRLEIHPATGCHYDNMHNEPSTQVILIFTWCGGYTYTEALTLRPQLNNSHARTSNRWELWMSS